jgi:hypothetical protein
MTWQRRQRIVTCFCIRLIPLQFAKDTAMAETFKHGGNGSTVPQPPGRGDPSHDAARDSTGIMVPARFRGTAADQQDMVVLGRKQVLRRNFRFTTILGFASTGQYTLRDP